MGIWRRSPRVDPVTIARLQAEVDTWPDVQAFRAGFGSAGDPWSRGAGGRVTNPQQLSELVKQRLGARLPDGYDVSQDGQIVYTNKTPGLQQAVIGSLPITGPFAAQALIGAAGAGGAAGAAAGPGAFTTIIPGTGIPTVAGAGGTGMVLPAVLRGAGAGASGGGWLQAALFQGLPTIANLFGARMQVGASDRASEIQARSAREALDEIRRQYDIDRAEESRRYEADVTAFAPYNEVGGRSVTRMGDLALSAQPEPYRPVPIRDTPLPPRGSMADLSRPTGQAQSGRGTVMMQAPTGQRKAVPMSQVSWWESRGARRVA